MTTFRVGLTVARHNADGGEAQTFQRQPGRLYNSRDHLRYDMISSITSIDHLLDACA